MFVTAAIASERMSANVRIRNISSTGALIEGAELPELGERVHLRRGSMAISGNVVRREGKYAGVHFIGRTSAESWLPTGDGGQQRVDRVVHAARDLYPNARPSAAFAASRPHQRPQRDELLALADSLDALANALGEDNAVVMSYLTKLQVLDIASQKLRALARED
mgnify:CR=1 FL=1